MSQMSELLYRNEVFQLAGVCMEIFEAKAVEKVTDSHIKQVLNYLAASKLRLGLLVNFGGDSLEWKRVVL
jgi:GxxExxY protein